MAKINKTTVQLQLYVLAFIAFSIAWVVILAGVFGYDYSWFNSISASATTNNTTAMILPFLLGQLALFSLCYKGYDKWDFWLTKIMALGFTLVALQPCQSSYNELIPKIGFFAVNPSTSNLIHSLGAVFGFAAMIAWVGLCFTKSNLPKDKQTKQKHRRNKIYKTCALLSLVGVIWMLVGNYIIHSWPNIWIAEMLILTPLSFAVFIKAGFLFKDRVLITK